MSSAVLWLVASYFIGAIPTSYLLSRFFAGIDLRRQGSGNLGATNLYRVLGWKYALPVALFDIAKGVVPVLVLAPIAIPEILMGVSLLIFFVLLNFTLGLVSVALTLVLRRMPKARMAHP